MKLKTIIQNQQLREINQKKVHKNLFNLLKNKFQELIRLQKDHLSKRTINKSIQVYDSILRW
ncbi:Uncharacterised protein [Mycobacterium tuberculosis]|nr:Uncharacterised protein [Mycobacterium tuberculosis]